MSAVHTPNEAVHVVPIQGFEFEIRTALDGVKREQNIKIISFGFKPVSRHPVAGRLINKAMHQYGCMPLISITIACACYAFLFNFCNSKVHTYHISYCYVRGMKFTPLYVRVWPLNSKEPAHFVFLITLALLFTSMELLSMIQKFDAYLCLILLYSQRLNLFGHMKWICFSHMHQLFMPAMDILYVLYTKVCS